MEDVAQLKQASQELERRLRVRETPFTGLISSHSVLQAATTCKQLTHLALNAVPGVGRALSFGPLKLIARRLGREAMPSCECLSIRVQAEQLRTKEAEAKLASFSGKLQQRLLQLATEVSLCSLLKWGHRTFLQCGSSLAVITHMQSTKARQEVDQLFGYMHLWAICVNVQLQTGGSPRECTGAAERRE